MDKKDWIIFIKLVTPLVIFISIFNYVRNKDIEDNPSRTCGIISSYGKTTKGIVKIEYHYFHEGKILRNIVGNGYFKDCDKTGWCIGKCFEVQYSSKHPENSYMDFDKPCDCPKELDTTKTGQY